MVEILLANPNEWLPPVDQVDRPYFIAIEKNNRVYSEYTNFNAQHPVSSSKNNWYEDVNQEDLQCFIIKGRFGYYWIDMRTGTIFCDAQHEVGDHPIVQRQVVLAIGGELINKGDFSWPFKLRHFKTSEVAIMGGTKSPKIFQGMNTKSIKPVEKSNVTSVAFGWELKNHQLGRITFEGIVSNRFPQFSVRLLFTPHDDFRGMLNLYIDGAGYNHSELNLGKHIDIKKGETITWEEKVL